LEKYNENILKRTKQVFCERFYALPSVFCNMRASDIQTDGEIWVCLFTIFVWNFDRGETGEQDQVDRREN